MAKKEDNGLYLIKIQLKDVKPAIWRRIVVPRDINLADFNLVLMTAMGWTGMHLSAFEDKQRIWYRVENEWFDDDDNLMEDDDKNAQDFTLSQVLHAKEPILKHYYDFGDDWQHTITLEDDKYTLEKPLPCPIVCLAGNNACPLEDIGGADAYQEFKKAIQGKEYDRDYEFDDDLMQDFSDFDPKAFDKDDINEQLKKLYDDFYGVQKSK